MHTARYRVKRKRKYDSSPGFPIRRRLNAQCRSGCCDSLQLRGVEWERGYNYSIQGSQHQIVLQEKNSKDAS